MSTFPSLWYTSNSPIHVGQRECKFERWLGNHAGRHGTGYRRKGTAVPLATGAAVHDGIGLLGGWVLEWQAAHAGQRLTAVPDAVLAWAATEAADAYERKARTKGLELTKTDLTAAAAVNQLILEQRTLIEAQVWIYGLVRMAVMLSLGRLVSAEQEEGPVLDCSCGLGDWVGQWDDHLARGCAGICAMGRADAIWELFDGGTLVYEEVKTKATSNYGWEQQWEHSGQLWLNMEAAERRIGRPIAQAYVPVLYKGRRDRTDREDKTAPKIQQSPLVYGWYDDGAPPLRPAEWAARYKWFDDWGKGHTLPRTFKRTAIFDEAVALPAQNPNGAVIRPEASRVERWVKGWILPIQYRELLQVLGPFPKPAILMQDAERSLLVEERKWRADVAWLRALGLYQASDRTAEGTTAADLIPRSWACTKFDGTPCSFKPICHREPGWESMETIGYYEIRTPHHAIEKEAMTPVMQSLGLAWTDPEDEGDSE